MVRPDINRAVVVRQYASGLSLTQLCAMHSVGQRTLKRILTKQGVAIRGAGPSRKMLDAALARRKEYPWESIASAYANGCTVQTICKVYRIHARVLHESLKRCGLPARTRSQSRHMMLASLSDEERKRLCDRTKKAPALQPQ